MKMSGILINCLLASILVIQSSLGSEHSDPHFVGDRKVIVQMMEWKFSDIATECELFLGPKGYAGVQTSPVAANAVITNPFRPWWERYQPVSYNIDGRSGNENDFRNMVDRCNKAGVRVYVDVILNHMTGGLSGNGTDGSSFDGNAMNYPGVPYSSVDFHGPESCPTSDLEIHNYDNAQEARNCRLGGLRDLNQYRDNVRQKQADFLNKMIDAGVAGFRSDASKHQWPSDLEAIIGRLSDLNTQYFPGGTKPFFAHEFIQGGTAMKSEEYFSIGRVMEFRYFRNLAEVFRKRNNQNLKKLNNFGEEWGFVPSGDGVVMVDSHDLQRGQTGDLDLNIAYFEPRLLKMATAFMLSWPYSITRVMSSYYWPRNIQNNKDENQSMGPPNENGEIKSVTRNSDTTCNDEWVCEHRWTAIANMAKFRNVAGDAPVANWWDNGNNAIAFSRGSNAFIVINNDDSTVDNTFSTGLPEGKYCDVISGENQGGKCTGKTITVGSDGTAHITLDNNADVPVVAIHVQAKL